jgi:hypothetical protein
MKKTSFCISGALLCCLVDVEVNLVCHLWCVVLALEVFLLRFLCSRFLLQFCAPFLDSLQLVLSGLVFLRAGLYRAPGISNASPQFGFLLIFSLGATWSRV